MKLLLSLIVPLVLLASLSAPGATFRRITDTGPWGDYEAFPDVCRMANGDLYVVFYAGYGHVSNPRDDLPRGGAVYGLRSSDEGKTWSDPILVVDTPEDDRDPHVTQLANGDLLASFFDSVYYTEDGKRKRRAETYVVRSADGGNTWGDPEVVTTPYQDTAGIGRRIFVSGPVAQLKGPHVVLPIYYEEVAGHYVTSVVHSEDFGHTWTRHSPVDPEASLVFSYGFCEASIARVSDGRLIILMRPGMHQAYSDDEGRTWSKATQLPHRGDAPTVMITSKNVLLVAHRHPGTAVTISADDGASWGRPHQIDTVGGAYPGLVELKDGSILCIYYEEGKASNIRQAIFTVEPSVQLENLHQRWPVPPPPGAKLDLAALHADGKLTVTTDMDTAGPRLPGAGPQAAFDGSIEYMSAAWKGADGGPATFTLALDQSYELTGLGICLKQSNAGKDYPESAEVYLSLDGQNWDNPVVRYTDAAAQSVRYSHFATPIAAQFVKVIITKAEGWPSLNEIELYAE